MNRVQKFLFIAVYSCNLQAAIVTYQFSGGRFGDNLLAYLHAKWVSFKYGIPLAYKPFKYSEFLHLHVLEKNIQTYLIKDLPKNVLTNTNMRINSQENSLIIVPYFTQVKCERLKNKNWIDLPIDWDEKKFYQTIVELTKPLNPKLADFNIPKNCITVALHVRKGEGFDGPLLSDAGVRKEKVPYADLGNPLKFPPEYFFIEHVKKISEHFANKKIYAYIFTDAKNPSLIAQRFKSACLQYPNIEFDYRKTTNNSHDTNVLEDFFAMIKFDCLVRPESSFSIAAAKLANYKLEIYPTDHHWEGNRSVIDKIEIKGERAFH